MTSGLVYHARFLDHETAAGHPERPDRLRAIDAMLHETGLWDRLQHVPFEPAPIDAIHRLHDPAYVERVFAACRDGRPYIDTPDSSICPASAEIARLAVGGGLAAVDAVMDGFLTNAFCAMRPPGHHAERDRSMGFCLFNNIALAAEHLITRHGLRRIAIVDFDVHHGNGTQHLFEMRDDVLFISLHQDPDTLYPGTGYAEERGQGAGKGFTINIPLPPGSDDGAYRQAMASQVGPALEAYDPQFLLISAGFDAAAADPLANMNVSPEGFGEMTRALNATAEAHCLGRVVSFLEGGYDLVALARSVERHLISLVDAAKQASDSKP